MVMVANEYSDEKCDALSSSFEVHVDLKYKQDNEYVGIVKQIYYILSAEIINQMVCNNVNPGVKYAAL